MDNFAIGFRCNNIQEMQLLSPKPSSVSSSSEYISFRSRVSQKKIVVDDDSSKVWTIYDAGPRNVSSPLICLPPVSGTADVFFNQIIALSAKGYRVIAIQYPVYWTIKDWVTGFSRLLDYLGLEKVHLFGASLGGFLAQKFAEYAHHTRTVHSLILCNSFTDTSIFNYTDTAVLFWIFPAVVLKRMIMGNFSRGYVEPYIADSIDFMVEKLDSLSQPELASRLTLTCMNCYVQPQKLHEIPITIIDVFDESSLSPSAREELYKFYPDAKRAHLKKGGNFPYISVSDEVNLHIQIHLRPFENTKYSACDGPVISQPSETASSYYDPVISQQNEEASVSDERVISLQNEKASVANESVSSYQNEKASVADKSVFSYQNEKASTSDETVISPQNSKENDGDS